MDYWTFIFSILVTLIIYIGAENVNKDARKVFDLSNDIQSFKSKRSIQKIESLKWDPPVAYYIANGINQSYITKAIENIENNTCITFSKKEATINNDYGINFVMRASCDFDFYGKNPTGKKGQFIYIGSDCSEDVLKIQEYIHYALGVKSEHNRIDRENYISIDNDNVDPLKSHKFTIDDETVTSLYDTQYDFGSFTHASPTGFGKNKAQIVTAKEHHEYYKEMMGQKIMVSFNDYKLLNMLYCDKSETCTNFWYCGEDGGYLDYKNCRNCICPYGFTGNTCTDIIPHIKSECKLRNYDATYLNQQIYMQGKKSCYFWIGANYGKKVCMTIKSITFKNNHFHCVDGRAALQIKYKKDRGTMGLCFCKNYGNVDIKLKSDDNLVFVHYNGTDNADLLEMYYQEC
uniref:Metalloendopeptidase n=1 Tax=Parastrongyloides trichosuri TaxID=131310 RepID=A0A0N5A0S5_PARTI